MVDNFILSALKGSLSSGKVISFSNLNEKSERVTTYDRFISIVDAIKDIFVKKSLIKFEEGMFELDIKESKSITPRLKITEKVNSNIPIIGIGGAGNKILMNVINRIRSYELDMKVLGIDTDKSILKKDKHISHIFQIPGANKGTGQQYRVAAKLSEKSKTELKNKIQEYLKEFDWSYEHEIVFILLGAGGTGVGAGIEVAKTLIELGKRPVPIIMLPSKDEMTRIKFMAAVAMYYFNYAPPKKCLNLTSLIVDNETFAVKNDKTPFKEMISISNERIGATIADLILSTELRSDGYSSDLVEFLEVFKEVKGVGVLQYLNVRNSLKKFNEILKNNLSESLSLDVDIFSSTRGYFFVSSKANSILAGDYREFMLNFSNSDIFSKLYEIETETDFLAVRGIYTGIELPKYITDFMELAEDARVDILKKNIEKVKAGKTNPKIDKLKKNEKIDVKTGQEVSKEKAENFAKMISEGEESD